MILAFITLIGIIIAPCFTLGAVLVYYDHPILGVIALIISVIRFIST